MTDSRQKALENELKYIKRCERDMQKQAMRADFPWKKKIESRIPETAHRNLEKAFAKAFAIIFEKGVTVIEKSFDKDALMQEHAINNVNVDISQSRDELKNLRTKAAKSDAFKSLFTTVEGVGLGVFGIGLPDIVFFIGYILKGIYETSLKYGYDYDRPEERYLILKMMYAAIQKRESWVEADIEVDYDIENMVIPSEYDMNEQIEKTAEAFAIDMLAAKFIQGIPVVGVLGGLTNPYYYMKIMEYVRVKYHKRYLLAKI